MGSTLGLPHVVDVVMHHLSLRLLVPEGVVLESMARQFRISLWELL